MVKNEPLKTQDVYFFEPFWNEYRAANYLYEFGVNALRNPDITYLPAIQAPVFALISTGMEKFLKLTLGLISVNRRGIWEDTKTMKGFGHRLSIMNNIVMDYIKNNLNIATNPKCVELAFKSVPDLPTLNLIIKVLERYANSGRFYYIDELTGNEQSEESPDALWDKVESKICELCPNIHALLSQNEVFEKALGEELACYFAAWRKIIIQAGIQGLFGDRGILMANDILSDIKDWRV